MTFLDYLNSTNPPLLVNVVCERPLSILGSSTYVCNWFLLSILGWRLCGSGSCQRPQTKPRHQQFFWGHSGQCTKTLSRGDWASSSTSGLWLYFSWKSNPEVPFIYYVSTFFLGGGGGQNGNFDLFSVLAELGEGFTFNPTFLARVSKSFKSTFLSSSFFLLLLLMVFKHWHIDERVSKSSENVLT